MSTVVGRVAPLPDTYESRRSDVFSRSATASASTPPGAMVEYVKLVIVCTSNTCQKGRQWGRAGGILELVKVFVRAHCCRKLCHVAGTQVTSSKGEWHLNLGIVLHHAAHDLAEGSVSGVVAMAVTRGGKCKM